MTRADQDARRARDMKFRAAQRPRARWTPEELADEESRLEAEIQALIAAGAVTRCPTVWATGAVPASFTTDS